MTKIIPHLWYTREAEEAAKFYARVFPDSRINRVTALPNDSPVAHPAQSRSSNSRCSVNRSWQSALDRSTRSTMRSHLW